MELEIINKLFLELSQIATTKTARELGLERGISCAQEGTYQLCLMIEDAGASPKLTECSIKASELRKFLSKLC